MRLLTIVVFHIFVLSCTSTKKTTTLSNPLNGTWVPVQEEIAGNALPSAAFQTQKLVLNVCGRATH